MLVLSLSTLDLTTIEANLERIDCIEYRLDLMPSFEFNRPPKPFIFTLRHQMHGGAYLGSIDKLCQDILTYCQYSPDFVDLDIRLPKALFARIRQDYPHIKIIASYHQFVCDIDQLKSHINTDVDSDYLKLAMNCDQAIDVLHLFQLQADRPMALIPMGDKASFGRVLGKIMGNSFDFVAPDHSQLTASGQLCLHDIHDIYHYQHLNRETKIYALLAQPVTHSVGHLFHNQCFLNEQRNAVYIKIEQNTSGLAQLLALMLEFPFEGLSLSMPLKQSVFPGQTINTLVRQNGRWVGYNTDGQAVIKLLGLEQGMTVLILGNGGAAQGIEQACLQQGVKVIFVARHGRGYRFEDDIPHVDAIINTLPNQAYIERPWFNPKLQICICKAQKRLDIIYHEVTIFQELCSKQQLPFSTGIDMFEAQAQLQQELWKLKSFSTV